jgi:hypothetical protein
MSEEKIDDALRVAERDAEILQDAIIHGYLQPTELAAALSALQRQALTNVRLLTIVGDDKFVTSKELRPWKAGAYAIAGSMLTIVTALVTGRLS